MRASENEVDHWISLFRMLIFFRMLILGVQGEQHRIDERMGRPRYSWHPLKSGCGERRGRLRLSMGRLRYGLHPLKSGCIDQRATLGRSCEAWTGLSLSLRRYILVGRCHGRWANDGPMLVGVVGGWSYQVPQWGRVAADVAFGGALRECLCCMAK